MIEVYRNVIPTHTWVVSQLWLRI